MNDLVQHMLELNAALVILYLGYWLFFKKDSNFFVRRVYLITTLLVPVLLILLPDAARNMAGRMAPVTFQLDQITVIGQGSGQAPGTSFSVWRSLVILYFSVAATGLVRLLIQMIGILLAVKRSERLEVNGMTLYANRALHASSFFGYVFVDPDRIGDQSFEHIVEHERVHRREWHSVDRILTEMMVAINWFNPVVWMLRNAVIENLEYLADKAVVEKGTDRHNYQLSILNQYMGSASLTNQFNSQIKNRINMLNRNDKLGSTWKLVLVFPMICLSLFFFSCTDKDDLYFAENDNQEQSALSSEVFYIVEEMPLFQDEDPAQSFRKYIAQNLRYPEEASKNGVAGRVYITFVVTPEGKVVIPEKEDLARITGKELGEVVVVGYQTSTEQAPRPDEEYINLLKNEVIRVVRSSPDWKPGKQRGKKVNVMYTFPVNFTLQ